MTAADLTAMMESSMSSRANRRMLADALTDLGRDMEAAMVIGLRAPVVRDGRIVDMLAGRRAYYEHCPRGFANEYDIYIVPAWMAARFEAAVPDAERITRGRAIRRGWSRPMEAKRDGEQWYGGFAGAGDSLEDEMNETVIATLGKIETAESFKEAVADDRP